MIVTAVAGSCYYFRQLSTIFPTFRWYCPDSAQHLGHFRTHSSVIQTCVSCLCKSMRPKTSVNTWKVSSFIKKTNQDNWDRFLIKFRIDVSKCFVNTLKFIKGILLLFLENTDQNWDCFLVKIVLTHYSYKTCPLGTNMNEGIWWFPITFRGCLCLWWWEKNYFGH